MSPRPPADRRPEASARADLTATLWMVAILIAAVLLAWVLLDGMYAR
jgi:hypothetical protein